MLLEYDAHNIIIHNYYFENRKSKEYNIMYVMQHNSSVRSHMHKNNMQLVGEY